MQDRTSPPSGRERRRTSHELYEEAKRLFPGATQLFGKRQEMFAPGQWPAYFAEAQGCRVVDLDGNEYTDMCTAGIGATLLGYADPDVSAAVISRVERGSMCMLNPPDEVRLAQLLIELHPWADQVRLGRMGGETMAMAIRIARARTGRDRVAFCGYHGWHDWYLSANLPVSGDSQMEDRLANWHLLPGLEPKGIVRGLAGTALPFGYNRIDELQAIVDRYGSQLAAIVLETTRREEPQPGFLEAARELADRSGARLIFDEISIGWKLCVGGAHLKYGIQPDLAVFAKSTGNGHPISAVIGTADTMQAAQETFISSALWTEAVGPAAGVATIEKMLRVDVPSHVAAIGLRVQEGLSQLAATHGVPLECDGHPALTVFQFNHPQAAALQTLWTVRMLDHGFLVSSGFFPMWAHQDEHVDAFLAACDPVLAELGQAIAQDDVAARIGGPVKHTGFQRLA